MASPDFVLRMSRPQLHSPVLLAAFAGWNDASQAATFALTTILREGSGQRFAEIEPEEFFDFTESRPTVSLKPSGQRALQWPANSFFAQQRPETDKDVVLLVGTEPQLKWKTFCAAIVELAQEVGASCLVTLGALLADVPHTMETQVTGFVSEESLLPWLRELNVQLSSYEGPTGILGALHDAWRKSEVPSISLWASVPHYISASPNPQASLALLSRIQELLHINLSLAQLEAEAETFRQRIDEALVDNPEAREYVQQLERHHADETTPPPGPELIEELERFLRSRRPPDDSGHDS